MDTALNRGVMTAELAADFEKQFPSGPSIRAELTARTDAFSVTVLFGPSGSGKTTVLRCLAGLEVPTRGRVQFGSETWFDSERHICLPPQRRRLGFLSQDYALFPHLTVAANIGYALGAVARPERQIRIRDLMRMVELEGLERRFPRQLSGGQQQRVALARALASRPRLLLLDEPLSALGSPTREELRRELRAWLAEWQAPTLLVTHDRGEAMALGDRVVILDQGRVLQSGPAEEVFTQPASVAAARIVGVETIEPARVLKVEAGMATVAVGSVELKAPARNNPSAACYICIRAQDVTLEKNDINVSPGTNRLTARVEAIAQEGPTARIGLDCGFSLTAVITRLTLLELAIEEGETVRAVFKPEAVHLISV
jgi:molybdate transport system ATP-binding protein